MNEKRNKAIIGNDGQTVLNPHCSVCGHRCPLYLMVNGVCNDCRQPTQVMALSRSVVSVAALNSAYKRGENSDGRL